MSVLSLRALNRALLQRQFLMERTGRTALQVVGHLVAMQAQEPNWPYVGLWSRIDGFTQAQLSVLLEDRTVVRSALLRSTQHLAVAGDFRRFRPVLQPVLDRTASTSYFRRVSGGLETDALTATGARILAGRTLPRRELARLLALRHPGREGKVLAGEVELRTPLVHTPETATWGRWGTRNAIAVTRAEDWLGAPMTPASAQDLVRRYLAAYGPAGVMDVQAWSGLTRLREVIHAMRGELRSYRDPGGRELFDLETAPEPPDPRTPVPVRFLPAFDNLLLGHADRTRVIGDADRRRVMPGAAMVLPTFLVDGFVHGSWSLRDGTLRLVPFRPLGTAETNAVTEEAERLLPFLGAAEVAYA
ncbi:winged helix DNA-binding domain-containing protein [Microbispora triticiradicis]|uniref:winged helix DNA-binding domain-containing protein n=1 Tax=Microbispora triticiradicis TaxID=2200763 RepID=UPI001AD687CA|nr:winged helix DNA-binding domain-containing protein [Microbispora triticiradicis]MBO4272195.1 winged helix DNA-binding domain-containing protein [Microbispora triticiradicis]